MLVSYVTGLTGYLLFDTKTSSPNLTAHMSMQLVMELSAVPHIYLQKESKF